MEELDIRNMSPDEIKALSLEEKMAILGKLDNTAVTTQDHFDNLSVLVDSINVDEWKDIDPELKKNYQSTLDSATQLLQSSPELKELRKVKKNQEAIGKLVDLGKNIADIVTSNEQVDAGKAAAEASVRPSRPKYKMEPGVQTAINESLRGASPAGIEAQLAPIKQDIEGAYKTGDVANRVASAGNAGTYASLAQSNLGRKYKAIRGLGDLRANIRGNFLKNLNYALQNRLAENRAKASMDSGLYGQDMRQYQLEQEAAGNLMAVGRQNRRMSIRGTADSVVNMYPEFRKLGKRVGDLFSKNKTDEAPINDEAAINSIDSFPKTNFEEDMYNMDMHAYDKELLFNSMFNPFRGKI